MNFSSRLTGWYEQNGRSLPWRVTRDPYHIWISEIILQQTRMDQGLAYYHRFLDAFPDVFRLAAATEEEVLRQWQGLGYYSRARNLHHAAKEVVEHYGGVLPSHSTELIRLKGIGPYTAAAIASMAFGEAIPAIDGNVLRVLSRIFAVDQDIDTGPGKKVFAELAMNLLPEDRAGDFNQALMDFGSLICKPARPLCLECIFRNECIAFQRGSVKRYPLRTRKNAVKERFFNYFLFRCTDHQGRNGFLIQRRQDKDIWQNMYEFPLLESDIRLSVTDILSHPWWRKLDKGSGKLIFAGPPSYMKHKLTHQTIHASFFQVYLSDAASLPLKELFQLTTPELFEDLPKPKLVDHFFRVVNFC